MSSLLSRKPYPSDLTDEEWVQVKDLFHAVPIRGRQPSVYIRDILNAILYVDRTKCAWRMMPHDFPPSSTVYNYFCRWKKDGTLDHVRIALRR